DDFAGNEAADQRAPERADAADHDDDEGLHQHQRAHVGHDRHNRRVDDASEAGRHAAEAEYDEEGAPHIDAENVDHQLIFDAGAHDQPEPRAVEQDIENDQRRCDDAEHLDAVGRIIEEAEIDRAGAPVRHRQALRDAAEIAANGLDHDDAEAERHQDLVLMRPAIVVAHQNALEPQPE